MSVKDHENFYSGLADPAAMPDPTPNTVSRSLKVGDRAFQTVVFQSGKAVLDSEFQLQQDANQFAASLLNRHQAPSGWLRGHTRHDVYCDYTLGANAGLLSDIPAPNHNGVMLINSFIMPRLVAQVAGMPVVVEYSNTSTSEYNLITLPVPTIYGGPGVNTKRTDFVFLEVWKAIVAPSPKATGTIEVVTNGNIVAGDQVSVDGNLLTEGVDWAIGGDATATALSIAGAINTVAPVNTLVTARANANVVTVQSIDPGLAGNAHVLALVLVNAGCITVSGGPGPVNLAGGLDYPNKPTQSTLYPHGNVLAPSTVGLPDELEDPVVNTETTQRIQLQYRLRSTGTPEAVNYKTHPDGFSAKSGGNRTILAQCGNVAPVVGYPFVPADRTTTEASSSAVAYGIDDSGLWVAGDGTQAAAIALGAADGFVYAIPVCFVHRYNDVSTGPFFGFDPETGTNCAPLWNHAGYVGIIGVIPPGLSDRPDQHFADVIVQENLLDLRRHVIFPGVDTSAELQYQIQSLLDGSTRTWSIDASSKQLLGNGSGDVSTQFLVCNAIGRSAAHGGHGNTSTRGDFQRDFDHIARRFGDQSIVERVVFSFYPGDRTVGAVPPGITNLGKYVTKAVGSDPAAWYVGDVLHLDLTQFNPTTLGGIFQGGVNVPSVAAAWHTSDCMPVGTVITDVLSIRHDDGYSVAAVGQDVQAGVIQGLGTLHVEIPLDTNPTLVDSGSAVLFPVPYPMVGQDIVLFGSQRRIFVEIEITYPIGAGTTDTVYYPLDPDTTVYDGTAGNGPGPVIADDVSEQPNDMQTLLAPRFREGYREVQLEYQANDTTGLTVPDQLHVPIGVTAGHEEYLVSMDQDYLRFPRRVFEDRANTKVSDMLAPGMNVVDLALTEWGSSSRLVKTSVILTNPGQTLCQVEYFAQDPIPNYGNSGYQLNVYFRTNAPQTAGVVEGVMDTIGSGVLPATLHVEPLCMGSDVWTGQVGAGSQDRAFPYLAPMDQMPTNDGDIPGQIKEWYFCGTADVTIADFNADTGLVALRPFVQADGQNILEFGGAAADQRPRKDADFRAYYPFAADWMYRPTVLSQPLYGAVRHKVLFPFLARAVEDVAGSDDGLLYRKNELLLVVLTRFAELDDENTVRFTDPLVDNRTCAALYRTRNLLLLVGDRACVVPGP